MANINGRSFLQVTALAGDGLRLYAWRLSKSCRAGANQTPGGCGMRFKNHRHNYDTHENPEQMTGR